MFSRYLPVRAFSIAARLISEAKICTGKAAPVSFRYSCSDMAIENASSPVAQPATQTRIVSFAGRAWRMRGKTTFFKHSNDSGSRKKLVTLMSKSRWSAISSSESFSSRSLYSARPSILRRASRRRMRRLIIFSR